MTKTTSKIPVSPRKPRSGSNAEKYLGLARRARGSKNPVVAEEFGDDRRAINVRSTIVRMVDRLLSPEEVEAGHTLHVTTRKGTMYCFLGTAEEFENILAESS